MARKALAFLLVLTACTNAPSPAPPSGSSITGHSEPLETPCDVAKRPLEIVARGTKFDRSCLATVQGHPTTLRFVNEDAGVLHNVDLLPAPFGYNTPPPSLFFGEIVRGPKTITYRVPALPAGYLFMVCYVHHDVMYGAFGVAPTIAFEGSRARISWGRAPSGFVFDVEVAKPDGTTFEPWRQNVVSSSDLFEGSKGASYGFRVSLHRANRDVLGWSPVARVTFP